MVCGKQTSASFFSLFFFFLFLRLLFVAVAHIKNIKEIGKLILQQVKACIKIKSQLTIKSSAFLHKCKYFFPVIKYHCFKCKYR